MAYEFDLFISYRRAGNVRDWVQRHLHPVLEACLEDELPEPPRIKIDTKIETGAAWPTDLKRALQRSKYMLAVWSAPYFTSPWCVAEWRTMVERERLLGFRTLGNPRGLVLPVLFADGDYYPQLARDTQGRIDFRAWSYPDEVFSTTPEYLRFRDAVRSLAQEIAGRLNEAPDWADNWPAVTPPVENAPAARLPEL